MRLALARERIETDFAPAFAAPPGSRRRLALHARKRGRHIALGYKARRSWDLVEITTCPIAEPRLVEALPALTACTPVGCMILLKEALGDLSGKRAVVIGRSNLMGKPMAQLLLQADCTVTIAHSRTVDLPSVCREADILVAAAGRAEMVKADWIKPGAVVIDVGINRVPSNDPEKAAAGKTRLVGDVDFAGASTVASAITPVPGGVGPMTIACLLQNTLTAARRIHELD